MSHDLADKIHLISGENLICGEIISHKTTQKEIKSYEKILYNVVNLYFSI